MVGGGPSVLYDAVAVVVSATTGPTALAAEPAAKDFVTDAHAHCKFIGHTAAAAPLLDAAGVADAMDDGYHQLGTRATAKALHRGQADPGSTLHALDHLRRARNCWY